jgi:DNA-binding NarL/FixJ family response regulator
MKLVERDAELAVLRNLLTECMEGRGGLAIISGAPASGKTALLHTFTEEVARPEVTFLHATASRAERSLPLGVIDQLFAGASLSDESRLRVTRHLDAGALGVPLHEPTPDASGDPAMHVLRGLGEALLELAARGPVVIGVDDAHYADVSSLECLLYLARRLRTTPILVVLNQCLPTRQEYPRTHAELLRQLDCRHIRLEPLSHHGVTELLAHSLGPKRAERLGAACHTMSGGSPLLVRALIEDHQTSLTTIATEMVPGDAFAQAVATCLYRFGSPVQETAMVMAMLGVQGSSEVLGTLLDLDPESTAQAVTALEKVGLLHDGRFRHDAVQAAVLAGLDTGERAELRGRVARELYHDGVAAPVVAAHLLAAGSAEAAWSVPVLREAADHALADNQSILAIKYLRLAHKAATDERQRIAVKAALVRAEWRLSPSAADRHLPELTTAALDEQMDWRDKGPLILQLLWSGRVEEVAQVLETVERQDGTVEQRTNAVVGADLIRKGTACYYPEMPGSARSEPNTPARDLPSEPSKSLQAATLLNTVLNEGPGDDVLGGAERLLQGARIEDHNVASITAALVALVHMNRLDEAAYWCDSLSKEAADRRAPMWQALFAGVQGTIEVLKGRFAAAENSAQTALTLVSPSSWGGTVGVPIANMLLATTAMGKYDEAAAYLDMPVPDAMSQGVGGLRYLHARGRYYLAIGHLHAALDDFQTCGERMAKWNVDLPVLVPWRTEAAEAYLRLGQPAHARALAEEQLARLRPEFARTRGITLRVLAATSEMKQRPALLDEAVGILQESGDPYELALTLADLARVRQASGDDGDARLLTRRAHLLAEECGAELPTSALSQADAARKAAQHGPGGRIAELSDAELRVAALAAQGHTNRQIASKLFITVSTVEQHLTRVYRKLNTNRRTDLPEELQHLVSADQASLISWSPIQKMR